MLTGGEEDKRENPWNSERVVISKNFLEPLTEDVLNTFESEESI